MDLNRAANNIVCTIQNRRARVPVAHLTVVKHLVPSGDAGLFDLLIGGIPWASEVGDRGSTGRLEFELGRRTVTEHGAAGTHLSDFSINTTCVDKAHGGRTVAHNPNGPSVSVDLTSEADDIVCTITNRRDAPRFWAGAGARSPRTHALTRRPRSSMRARGGRSEPGEQQADARGCTVGEVVPITITVKNVGHETAQHVRVRETPPHGDRIVVAADHGVVQRDGTVLWHIGSLAPGEVRTVRATLRVARTGPQLNRAVTTARNADPAPSQATLRGRARPPAPPPPAVTG